jgi:DDE family transposase
MVGVRKSAYKVTNWAKYNEALVNRGSITLWLDEEALASWEHDNDEVKRGRPFTYSDTAIECLLTLREVFQLPYRQTEGLAKSLVRLMQVNIPVPDFTSLAKRAPTLTIDLSVSRRGGPIDIVVDSTGLKVFGEGEWKTRKYGAGKRRTWRKLHLAINPATQEIEAELLTENSGHDADQVPELLEQVPGQIKTFRGDGAYDKWKVYATLATRGIEPIIPPQHNAKIKQHGNTSAEPLPRDTAIRQIRRLGRSAWKKEVGYHVRSLGETAMFRMKTIFGSLLKNRVLPNQQTEVRVRCKIQNRLTQLGLPDFKWD